MGCGEEEESQYGDKDYGNSADGVPTSGAQPDSEDTSISVPTTIPTTTPLPSEANTDNTDEDDDNTEPPPVIVIGDDDDDDEGNSTPPPIDPNTLISHSTFRAYFDVNGTQGITADDGYVRIGNMVNKQVKKQLYTSDEDGVVLAQTFGDGVSKSSGWQELIQSAGDDNREEGADTTSGTQYIDRVVDSSCPSVYLCINRMVFVPIEGSPATYCFRDSEGNSALFPYNPVPNYSEGDFNLHYGTYGPFMVSKYMGQNVDCDNPDVPQVIEEEVTVTTTPGEPEDIDYALHVISPLTIDFSVAFNFNRLNSDFQKPYIDETVLLNTRNEFAINDYTNSFTKMMVTSRKSIPDSFFYREEGVAVHLNFELCADLLDESSPEHCE